ncbi:MAG: hypothetical protein ACK5JC_09525 [Bacteroidota bacterium]
MPKCSKGTTLTFLFGKISSSGKPKEIIVFIYLEHPFMHSLFTSQGTKLIDRCLLTTEYTSGGRAIE